MKKNVVLTLLLVLCTVGIGNSAFAHEQESYVNESVRAQNMFFENIDKLQSIFPEVEALSDSNIKALKAKIERGVILDSKDINSSPVETYTKEVDGDFYSLSVYADLSMDTCGITGGTSSTQGTNFITWTSRICYFSNPYGYMSQKVSYVISLQGLDWITSRSLGTCINTSYRVPYFTGLRSYETSSLPAYSTLKGWFYIAAGDMHQGYTVTFNLKNNSAYATYSITEPIYN